MTKGLNRTTVELKFLHLFIPLQKRCCLNRTTVELKYKIKFDKDYILTKS